MQSVLLGRKPAFRRSDIALVRHGMCGRPSVRDADMDKWTLELHLTKNESMPRAYTDARPGGPIPALRTCLLPSRATRVCGAVRSLDSWQEAPTCNWTAQRGDPPSRPGEALLAVKTSASDIKNRS